MSSGLTYQPLTVPAHLHASDLGRAGERAFRLGPVLDSASVTDQGGACHVGQNQLQPPWTALLPGHRTALIAARAVIAATPVLVLLVLLSSGWAPHRTIDMTVLQPLNGYVIGLPVQFILWKTVSILFGPVVLSIVVFLAMVTLWLRRLRRSAILLATAMIGASLLSSILKILIARPRPIPPTPIDHASGYSFPSDHTLSSMVVPSEWP